MALAHWKNEYSVNIAKIDSQHKKLFDYLNEINDALVNKKPKEELGKIIEKIVKYAVEHFKTEEHYFDMYKYPKASSHKLEHQAFIKKVKEFQADYNNGKVLLSLKIINFLKDWLTKHILGTDKAYSQFLNEKGVK